jgi:hypothetical protein
MIPAGFSDAFERWAKSLREDANTMVVLATCGRDGRRRLWKGFMRPEYLRSGVVIIKCDMPDRTVETFHIPREEIVAWDHGAHAADLWNSLLREDYSPARKFA